MKKDIHPENYRPVVFHDPTADMKWLTKSTVATDKTVKWEDGQEYPMYSLGISSYSHPFYTGSQRLVDTEGRIDKFRKKYERKAPAKKKK